MNTAEHDRPSYRYAMTNTGTPWIYIVGEKLLVALRTPSEPAIVEQLWSLVTSSSTTFDDALRVIPNTSGGQPASFVALERSGADGDTMKLLVHGEAVVDAHAGGTWTRITSGDKPWHRDELSGVEAVAAGGLTGEPGAAVSGVSFPLGSGVIVANRIDWVADPEAVAVSPVRRDATAQAPAPTVAGPPTTRGTSAVPPAQSHFRPSPAETNTIIRPPVQRVRPEDDPAMRHDGETVLRRDIAPPIQDETVLRESPLVPNDPKTLLYGFRINGGQAYPLDAVHYFGRNPRQPRIPLPDPSRLVPVVSGSKSVSATHLEIKQIGDSIVATDLKSTNGTSIIPPNGHWRRLRQGESVVVAPGTFIDIGDGNVIEILPPWPGV
ncbi:FHA domain-containing protein [Mycetocola miduiensis]|uniref:FHA domain-containing protein n=1 Tax=Mycetocola miduiensis TaxID=995034 RepID=A0A1I4Y8L7_9MICO|nr:FHA domain-containing protein [Mycetocola miduiensis]SFN34073.1 FHA domain-containing protein [Mycetocola miduiensis]